MTNFQENNSDSTITIKSNSQFGQDLWVASLFKGKRNGYFLEIGGGNGLWISNTLVLEKYFGWKGILVEPTQAFEQLVKNRPNCITDNSCIASERKMVTLFEIHDRGQEMISNEATGNMLLSLVRDDLPAENGASLNSTWGSFQRAREVETVTLENILLKYDAPRVIDYFSLDVEGYEYEILKKFPFNIYKFLCLGVEKPPVELHKLLNDNDYKLTARLGEDYMYVHKSMII